MSRSLSTYPLRLLTSIKDEVMRRAKADGTSFNHFVATALAEKLAAMTTAAYFVERRDRADRDAFDRIVLRAGGKPPQPDDQMP
ncbi:MAG: toxin-antitoxin system HicB family antitoxin [Burkholderiaceae bacterium]|nr:toxin-antitoxin system HicB family antitoxin [Burkholderiaceae bacterium]